MSYKQIKWLILTIPTLIIGLWEYVRHAWLLPYISMEMGNLLSPVIIFLVTITLLRKLFLIYEQIQEQLKKEREEKAVMWERERIARELHDGIAQSLFLCSVQVNMMKQKQPSLEWTELDKSLHQIHDYVRHSISNLKSSPSPQQFFWKARIEKMVEQFEQDTGIIVKLDIHLEESLLKPKEKAELLSCIQEALTNIRKHANANLVSIRLSPFQTGWRLEIEDNGVGFQGNPFGHTDRFGLHIMSERVHEINGVLRLSHHDGKTLLVIEKGGIS